MTGFLKPRKGSAVWTLATNIIVGTMSQPLKFRSLGLEDINLYSFLPDFPTKECLVAVLLSINTATYCRIIMPLLAILLGTSAHQMSVAANTPTYLSTLTSSVATSPTTSVGQNDAGELQKKLYYLNIAGAIFTAITLSLSFVTTLIAVLDFRLRRKDRAEARRQGIIGQPRNPINDEAGRQARDALAQEVELESTNAVAGVGLATLAAVDDVDEDISPAPIPAERPSRNYNPP
ncbi:hypothetical protein K449DRAFT_431932 [Hypoxylon sp. EC38]|nr:hypothetical protein K449DRAFT_431932 [Hypoxylon sp. EC38]